MLSTSKFTRGLAYSLLTFLMVAGAEDLLAAPPAASQDIREYEILVKGNHCGTAKMIIEDQADGHTLVKTEASIRVNAVVYVYVYEFHGTQTWLGDRLEKFDSHTIDGRKKLSLTGIANPVTGKTDVVASDQRSTGPQFALTNDYWKLPAIALTGKTVPMVDGATGATKMVKFTRGADTTIPYGKTSIPCTEYTVTGDVVAKLWLDGRGRLVHQTGVEDGHATELRLTRLSGADTAVAAGQGTLKR
jgi:hypothetical protein